MKWHAREVRTIERRLQEGGDASLTFGDGPIFSTVAKLVEALERSIPEGSQTLSARRSCYSKSRPRRASALRDNPSAGFIWKRLKRRPVPFGRAIHLKAVPLCPQAAVTATEPDRP